MDDLEAMARMGTAQLRALVTARREYRECGASWRPEPALAVRCLV